MENTSKPENKTIMYVSCSEKIESYTGSKKSFMGKGTIANPDGINKVQLDNASSIGKEGCIAIQIRIELADSLLTSLKKVLQWRISELEVTGYKIPINGSSRK